MSEKQQRLIWIDLEMTGLDPEIDTIMEIATVVTDDQLEIIAEGPVVAVAHSDAQLAAMNEWCIEQHGKSGLTERCRSSGHSLADAERLTLDVLEQYVEPNHSPICGNSIGQDRRFLFKYMPTLEAFFHYRYLDVSTIKELAKRWRPEVANGFNKSSSHLAMDDIKDSIAELKHYREHWLS